MNPKDNAVRKKIIKYCNDIAALLEEYKLFPAHAGVISLEIDDKSVKTL